MKTKQYLCVSLTIILMLFLKNYSFAQCGTNVTNSNTSTQNNIPRYTSTTNCVQASQIWDNGSNVGINTASPGFKLEVDGGDINTSRFVNGYRINGKFVLWHNGGASAYTSDIMVGVDAGNATMSGHSNTLVGNYAGYAITGGEKNTFAGTEAGKSNTTGSDNVFQGYQAGFTKSTGNKNTIIGSQAGYGSSSTYSETTMVGYHAGYSNTSSHNTFLGTYAGYSNTTSDYNTFVGWESGSGNTNGGGYNTFVGHLSGRYNTTGANNVNIGYAAGFNASTGSANTFLGSQAGYTNTTHSSNVFVGYNAGQNSDADDNTAIGRSAGINTTSGAHNVFVGRSAGATNTTGQYNTAVGRSAGSAITSGSNNTFLGYGADVCAACTTYANVTAIGNGAGATIDSNNDIELGNTSVGQIWAGVTSITSNSDRRIKKNIQENVPGLAFINLLKPVTYNKDIHKQNSIIGYPMKRDSAGNLTNEIDTTMWDGKYDIENIQYSGFIAQQVDSAAQQIGYDFSGIAKPKTSNNLYGLNYTEFVVPLVKAVQELSITVDSLKATPSARKSGENNVSLAQKIAQLEELIKQCCTIENAKPTGENTNSGNSGDNKQNVKLTLPEKPTLGDPQPNPNNGSTVIPYYLPENSINAKVIFTDMLGRMMKEETLKIGYGSLYIDTQDLPSGMYSYTLVVDGKEVDNKKMIRNK